MTILKAENISKQYRLGLVGTGTLSDDLKRWWYRVRGKEDPFLKIGDTNDRSTKGESDYVWALRDINFKVQQGEVLGIIGKNGAGKSTLLKILSRVTAPSTGEIKTRGRIASLLEVGTGFHPELTGRENIYLNGAILGMTKAEIKAKEDEIIAFSGCERYVDTPVKRYSSGMRVRLAFAVAAFLEPDILVIDEVLAVGDAEFQKKAIGKMQDISKGDGRTVLFVSHNMAAVKSLCTRGIVLEHGRTVFEGTSEEAVSFYLTLGSRNSDTTLLERTDRLGNGKWKFVNVKFYNEKGNQVIDIISGHYLKITVEVRKYDYLDLKRIFFGVAFLDSQDQKVASFLSDEMNCDFTPLKNKNIISLEIPEFLLRAGTYSIVLQIGEGSTLSEDFIDLIEHAITFTVISGDYWNIGKSNRAGEYSIMPGKIVIE